MAPQQVKQHLEKLVAMFDPKERMAEWAETRMEILGTLLHLHHSNPQSDSYEDSTLLRSAWEHVEACLRSVSREDDALLWAEVHSKAFEVKSLAKDRTTAVEAADHGRRALSVFVDAQSQELRASCLRVNLARHLLRGVHSFGTFGVSSVDDVEPLDKEQWQEASQMLIDLQQLPNASPDLLKTVDPLLESARKVLRPR